MRRLAQLAAFAVAGWVMALVVGLPMRADGAPNRPADGSRSGITARPTTQPNPLAAPAIAATQGDDRDVIPPTITRVEPVGSAVPRANGELVPTPSDATAAKGTPPPIPTGRPLMDELLKTNPDATGARGDVPSTESVRKSLNVDRTVIAVRESRPSKPSEVVPVTALDPHKTLLPEGFIIRDRVGHIRRDGGRFLFVFDSDRNGNNDAPLILLPNSRMESMLSQSHNAQDDIRFRVTGTVTAFQQTNYLLLSLVLIEQNLDRF